MDKYFAEVLWPQLMERAEGPDGRYVWEALVTIAYPELHGRERTELIDALVEESA